MFRRIELIHDSYKSGLCGCLCSDSIIDSWIYKLRGPKRRSLPQNCKFYFTEKGWKEVGRNVITVCQKEKQKYKIICVKEKSVNIVWKDTFEVAAQPKKND